MKLQFLGADRQVTGSQYYLKTAGARILVDCGMFQERDFLERNWNSLPVPPRDIDVVLLTHAHLDHCGLLPKLVAEGFRGPIIATEPTVDLTGVILRDSAHIQAEDIEFKQKRHRREGRRGKYAEKPLYTIEDVERTLPRMEGVAYDRTLSINSHTSATFREAGHILGAASIELVVQENDISRRLIFSGDIGLSGKPFVRGPAQFTQADYVTIESTYGDRTFENHDSVEEQLASVIRSTVAAGGKLLIPVFAMERVQDVIYYMGQLIRAGKIPRVPVYVDSPMAAEINEIFKRHRDWFDPAMKRRLDDGEPLLEFPGLSITRTVEQSKAINHRKGPAIIMATSGMCTAGRIKHHLAQWIDCPECTILFVGYQATGTLGRQILDGSKEVRLQGISRRVRARVERIVGFSGHADRPALVAWLGHLRTPPEQVFVCHGEATSAQAFAQAIRDQFHWNATVPEYQQVVDLG